MSLFKILRGDSSRISMEVTPFHDGYAYYTPDDGGFYIDSMENGKNVRKRINPAVNTVKTILSANSWSNGLQTLEIEGLTDDRDGFIGVSEGITDEQMKAVEEAGLRVNSQSGNSITLSAAGDVPSIDIPVTIILLP